MNNSLSILENLFGGKRPTFKMSKMAFIKDDKTESKTGSIFLALFPFLLLSLLGALEYGPIMDTSEVKRRSAELISGVAVLSALLPIIIIIILILFARGEAKYRCRIGWWLFGLIMCILLHFSLIVATLAQGKPKLSSSQEGMMYGKLIIIFLSQILCVATVMKANSSANDPTVCFQPSK